MGPIEFIVLAFNQDDTAGRALTTIKELEKRDIIHIINAAVLVKDTDGKTHVKETADVGAAKGALFGAVAGGIIGLLGGPIGLIVGAAAGAATGGISANLLDMGFSNEFLDEVKDSLVPGSSALLAIIEHEWVDRLLNELEQFQGRLIRQALKDEVAAQLAEAKPEEAQPEQPAEPAAQSAVAENTASEKPAEEAKENEPPKEG